MTVDPALYRPPHCTQWNMPPLDDCRVRATQMLVAAGTNGESVRFASGREYGAQALLRQAKRMRYGTPGVAAAGPLDTADARRMVAHEFGFELSTPDLRLDQILDQLSEGFCFTLSGDPELIAAPSPLKRVSGGHEYYVDRLSRDGTRVLVYDPWRNVSPDRRGEWRPVRELRQFSRAFRDPDGTVVCTRVKKGAWREAALVKVELAETLASRRARINDLTARLERMQQQLLSIEADDDAIRVDALDAAIAALEALKP